MVSNKTHGQAWITFKVNFHIDNFTIVDKVIEALVPQSDVDHTLHDKLHGLHADVYTFLRYGYAVHTREGIKASKSINDLCEDFHQPPENEAQQFGAYQELEELVSSLKNWMNQQ